MPNDALNPEKYIDYLEHEVSRLRECRDQWKAQAEKLADRLGTTVAEEDFQVSASYTREELRAAARRINEEAARDIYRRREKLRFADYEPGLLG